MPATDWYVTRDGTATRLHPKTQGKLTHRQARSLGYQWMRLFGFTGIELQRRDGKQIIKRIVPRFPGLERRA